MRAILRKELVSFFASPIAYGVIAIFITLNGLFLWVFTTGYTIFEAGFAEMTAFFEWTPWMYIGLVPALAMRSFSEELSMRTLELLLSKPLSYGQLVGGKFLAIFIVIGVTLLPSVLYVFTLASLRQDGSALDYGGMAASYVGLLSLAAVYTAIGIFASALTPHQVVAFIGGAILCFCMYYGWEGFAGLSFFKNMNDVLINIGMKAHVESMSRGVLDIADLLYFVSLTFFFLYITRLYLSFRNG